MKVSKKTVTGKKRGFFKKLIERDQLEILSMTLPVFVQVFIFCYLPMLGVIVAFKNYKTSKGIFGSEWVGFKNFEFFFRSNDAKRVISNTLFYNAMFITLGIIGAVFLAILLSMITQKISLKVFQTTMLFPHFMSWVVVAYMALTFLDYKSGFLNMWITKLGGEAISWYSEPKWWPMILVIIQLWKIIGNNSLVYYAAIIGVDSELYESASLDGCSPWQQIWYIMLPMIRPTIITLAIMAIGNIFRADFGLFFNVPQNSGSLIKATDVIDTYIYRTLFVTGDVGISSAVGLVQSIVGFILVVTTNKVVKRLEPEMGLF